VSATTRPSSISIRRGIRAAISRSCVITTIWPARLRRTGRLTTRAGVRYWLARADGANIVAWVQAGHTCLIASSSTPVAELLTLAVAEHDVSPA